MQEEIEQIISNIKEFFESKSKVFDKKILPALEFMHDRKESVKANYITFWRNPGSKNLRLAISNIANDEEEIYETEFNDNIISDWDNVFSSRDMYQFYEMHGDSTQLEIKIEREFLLWFIKNWFRIEGHKVNNTKQIILENSTASGFDLNAMNYDEVIEGEHRSEYQYKYELTDHELLQRLKIFQVTKYNLSRYNRILFSDHELVEIEYLNGKLKHKNLPIQFIDIINSANKSPNKYFVLRHMTTIIDELIKLNYKEK